MLKLIAAIVAAAIFCLALENSDWTNFILLVFATYLVPEAFLFVVIVLVIASMFNSKSK